MPVRKREGQSRVGADAPFDGALQAISRRSSRRCGNRFRIRARNCRSMMQFRRGSAAVSRTRTTPVISKEQMHCRSAIFPTNRKTCTLRLRSRAEILPAAERIRPASCGCTRDTTRRSGSRTISCGLPCATLPARICSCSAIKEADRAILSEGCGPKSKAGGTLTSGQPGSVRRLTSNLQISCSKPEAAALYLAGSHSNLCRLANKS